MVDTVRTRRAFSTLSSSRNRGRSGPVWVVRSDARLETGPTDGADGIHVAYAVGKAVGNAVARNHLRRRLRVHVTDLEAVGALSPGLYLIGAAPDAAACTFSELGAHLSTAVSRLAPIRSIPAGAP